jgi:hypothetical protein
MPLNETEDEAEESEEEDIVATHIGPKLTSAECRRLYDTTLTQFNKMTSLQKIDFLKRRVVSSDSKKSTSRNYRHIQRQHRRRGRRCNS